MFLCMGFNRGIQLSCRLRKSCLRGSNPVAPTLFSHLLALIAPTCNCVSVCLRHWLFSPRFVAQAVIARFKSCCLDHLFTLPATLYVVLGLPVLMVILFYLSRRT